mmetsp:Transcript_25502/g.70431  ORF Transcript_25502/g.70431 Transcript_25502/m.70431 type:complete len:111 (-) Transcript_25502:580-912(-)
MPAPLVDNMREQLEVSFYPHESSSQQLPLRLGLLMVTEFLLVLHHIFVRFNVIADSLQIREIFLNAISLHVIQKSSREPHNQTPDTQISDSKSMLLTTSEPTSILGRNSV